MTAPIALIVDDDKTIRRTLGRLLADNGYALREAQDGEAGLEAIAKETPDVILMDIRMPGSSGLEVLGKVAAVDARIPVVIMTAHGTTATAIEAMKLGAFDYVLKPFDIPHLLDVLARASEAGAAMRHTVAVASLDPQEGSESLIGQSKGMREIYKMIGKIADSDITVLLEGETGTGKELVARAVYQHSLRGSRPFLAVNCAAIPETLLESELFGHERGAFTDAKTMRIGKFEQCKGGTVFLDEIGDMSLSTQSKILRVLQEQEFQRVGGRENIRVDVRVLAATNTDLSDAIRAGRFREDLYYRLNVVTIKLPPLRERREDIPLLARYFVRKFSPEDRRFSLTDASLNKLKAYPWPGNVRQLENVLRRAVVVTKKDLLLPSDLDLAPETGKSTQGPVLSLDDHAAALFQEILRAEASKNPAAIMDALEAKLLRLAMEHANGNQLRAARVLGMNRNTLRKKMQNYKISGRFKSHP